ncbi:class I SAM-dependent methyltransferase [Oscillospiraceae bacterium PP1C4]
MPKLDERLAALASLVRQGVRCADIGTDHGYLIAWLAACGKITSGYACDINQKPLDKAALSLSEYGVADRVSLHLCDGLSGLHAGDADDIVIAGMGGELIWEIIDVQSWTRDPNLHFLLQPMTKPERLRRSLYDNGFEILREVAVVCGDFPYTAMEVVFTGCSRTIDLAFAYVGPLLKDDSDAARQYIAKAARLIREKVEGMSKSVHAGEQLSGYQELLSLLESRCVQ